MLCKVRSGNNHCGSATLLTSACGPNRVCIHNNSPQECFVMLDPEKIHSAIRNTAYVCICTKYSSGCIILMLIPNSFLDDTWLIDGQSDASQSDTGVSSKKKEIVAGLLMLYGSYQCWGFGSTGSTCL